MSTRPSRATSPVLLDRLQASWYLVRFLFDPLGTVKQAHKAFGPFIIATAPSRWPIRRQNPNPTPTFVCGIGADFNREVMSDPITWRTVPLGPGGPRHSAARQ